MLNVFFLMKIQHCSTVDVKVNWKYRNVDGAFKVLLHCAKATSLPNGLVGNLMCYSHGQVSKIKENALFHVRFYAVCFYLPVCSEQKRKWEQKFSLMFVAYSSLLEINDKHAIAIDEWALLFKALSSCLLEFFTNTQNRQKWQYWHHRLYCVKTKKNSATKCYPSEHWTHYLGHSGLMLSHLNHWGNCYLAELRSHIWSCSIEMVQEQKTI